MLNSLLIKQKLTQEHISSKAEPLIGCNLAIGRTKKGDFPVGKSPFN